MADQEATSKGRPTLTALGAAAWVKTKEYAPTILYWAAIPAALYIIKERRGVGWKEFLHVASVPFLE